MKTKRRKPPLDAGDDRFFGEALPIPARGDQVTYNRHSSQPFTGIVIEDTRVERRANIETHTIVIAARCDMPEPVDSWLDELGREVGRRYA